MKHVSRPDETWHRLREWTARSGWAERLAAQVLLCEGFTSLDPRHPLGGRDGGADALARFDNKSWVMAVYFPLGQQDFEKTKSKFLEDSKGVKRNSADAMAFVTNQALTVSERKSLREAVTFPVEIFHIERVVAVLDQPKMHSVREQYLGIGKSDASLNREERLAELWRASVARCAARWQGVGLPKEEAKALAEEKSMGSVGPSMHPAPDSRVVVWTAPFGSGKSIASERYHQDGLERARDDETAPVPVFLRASESVPSLAEAVERVAREVASVRRVGARIVIDGVDEVGHQAAFELLTQARVLVEVWPSTTVLMTSRPLPVLTEAAENRALVPLGGAEQDACVQLGLGTPDTNLGLRLHALPESVRATLGQPFFALLVGLWMRERGGLPRAPIELMNMLGEKATRGLAVDEGHLRTLAVHSVRRELGPVPAGDVVEGLRPDDLLATGMIERRGGGLAFVLPALAQWFAAQAILLRELSIEKLLVAPEDLELWLYPLSLAVSLASADQATDFLDGLLGQEPGYAIRVLTSTFGLAPLGGFAPPPWRQAGKQARRALQALYDAVRPFSQLLPNVQASGALVPMAIATDQDHLVVAFWHGQEERDEVFALPVDFALLGAGDGWGSVRSSGVGPSASWAWQWAASSVRHSVDELLKARAFPIRVDSPLGQEAIWNAACALSGKGKLRTGEIELSELEQALQQVAEATWSRGPVPFQSGVFVHDLRGLRRSVVDARAQGKTTLTPSVPPADILPTGPGAVAWVGEFYSKKRLLEAATAIYQLALVAYRDIVDSWMPSLALQLEHYVLMPMRVVGYLSTGRGSPGGMVIPSLGGYFEALPPQSQNEVSIAITEGGYDFSAGDGSFQQQRTARPRAARWLSGRHGGLPLELGKTEPVADVVYSWLAHDLARVGLASPGTRVSTGRRFDRFLM